MNPIDFFSFMSCPFILFNCKPKTYTTVIIDDNVMENENAMAIETRGRSMRGNIRDYIQGILEPFSLNNEIVQRNMQR